MKVMCNEKTDYKKCDHDNMYKYFEKSSEKLPKDTYTYDLNVVNECSYKSKSIEISLEGKCSEKCIDVDLEKVCYTRIFGKVKDFKDDVVKNAKVSLFKTELINYKTKYVLVCNMITDEEGRYEAIINDYCSENHYIVRVIEC